VPTVTATGSSLINETIGNYRVVGLLGEGGMGVVYLAQHPVIGRQVAIKLLHAALARDQDIVARFFNEARAIHMIGHENIVEILDFGQTASGQPYFIMEYLRGESLSEAVARGVMPQEEVELIAGQMCTALAAAHSKGIVHRDLKPHNVQLCQHADGRMLVKILDFGVAKILTAPDGSPSVKTRTGSLVGTPLYMSPEQCKGAGVVDHRTDIYSLGVMLFEMLAGRPPFMAEGVGELFAKHMLEEPPSLIDLAPETRPHLAAAIMKSLAKEADDRFADMDEFRRALVGEIEVVPRRSEGPRPIPAHQPAGAQTLSASASTTLTSASSEIDELLTAPANRTKLLARLVVGISVAAAIGLFLLSRDRLKQEPPPSPAVQAPTAVSAPVVPTKKTVTIRFEAEPVGTHVFRKIDNQDLGPVPVEAQLDRSDQPAEYAFRLDGYREISTTAVPNADRTLHFSLDKLPKPAAPLAPDKHKGPSSGKHTPRRAKSLIDEDGLATPSF
jgi:serine/threonine protein kinase